MCGRNQTTQSNINKEFRMVRSKQKKIITRWNSGVRWLILPVISWWWDCIVWRLSIYIWFDFVNLFNGIHLHIDRLLLLWSSLLWLLLRVKLLRWTRNTAIWSTISINYCKYNWKWSHGFIDITHTSISILFIIHFELHLQLISSRSLVMSAAIVLID